MPLKKEVIEKYISPVFLETGSLVGEGIKTALDVGFQNIMSVELSDKYYNICLNRFRNNIKVKLFLGDVELVLWDMIKDIEERITFWIDAHESGGDTAKGLHGDPCIQELEIIKNHKRKDHIILIDDLRGMSNKIIEDKLKEINSEYVFCFEDGFVKNDVLVARLTYEKSI
jgi:hypothetical protein